jgi:two-component system, NtrC family, sensor kinase
VNPELAVIADKASDVLANEEKDETAYAAAILGIASALGAKGSAFIYRDSLDEIRVITPDRPNDIRLTEGQASPLTRDRDASAFLATIGFSFAYTIVMPVAGAAIAGCSMAFGRDDRSFDDDDSDIAVSLISRIAPLISARCRQSRSERARIDAERALRKNEKRLESLFEESHDMIYSVDRDDTIVAINAAGLTLLGLREQSEAIGKKIAAFVFTPTDRIGLLSKITSQGYADDYEIILRKASGAPVFCIESAQCIRDSSGGITEILGFIKDISDRIVQERELWKTNMELAATNCKLQEAEVLMVQHEKLASIGQLAAGIAHEINNPLGFLMSNHAVFTQFVKAIRGAWAAIRVASPSLVDGVDDQFDIPYVLSELDTMLAETSDGLSRIMAIVRNLKSFAREEMETTIAPYDLNKGVENTLIVARNEIKYVADIELRLGKLPEIEASAGEVNQVLLNLLVNSAQAIEGQKRKDRGRIIVTTKEVGDRAVCEIADDGPGVPDELRHRIFDPFFTTKGPGKGTGLGLSISYDLIVKKHGGTLYVEHSPLGGALFRMELPFLHAPRAAGNGHDRGGMAGELT